MRPVSYRFLEAAKRSHTMIARATYCTNYQTTTTPTGTRLPIIDGNVKMSSTSAVRSTLDLTVTWPWADQVQPITPYGDEIYVERGIDYGDGTREWVGLGYFRVESVEQNETPNGPLRISGRDRMAQVVDSRLEAPVQYLAGQTTAQPIVDLILDVYPSASILADYTPSNIKLTSNQVSDEKRYEFLDEIITAAGRIWYWNYKGQLMLVTMPRADQPVWEVHAGPGGLLINSSRELSRSGVYNAVVAYGQTADTVPPCRAVVRDMNMDSATYWDGSFGHVPRFFSSSFLQTDDQCRDAAASLLAKVIGLPYSVNFDTIPNPALEPFDPISIKPGPNENNRTFVIDQLTIPLVANKSMTGTVRDRSNQTAEGN